MPNVILWLCHAKYVMLLGATLLYLQKFKSNLFIKAHFK